MELCLGLIPQTYSHIESCATDQPEGRIRGSERGRLLILTSSFVNDAHLPGTNTIPFVLSSIVTLKCWPVSDMPLTSCF
jgi:hypothetical protein